MLSYFEPNVIEKIVWESVFFFQFWSRDYLQKRKVSPFGRHFETELFLMFFLLIRTYHENLSWKNHIDGITKTISRNIGVINKLKFIIPKRILHTLYCTLVLPYINYGILIWGKACKTYLEKIHKLQKWAVRIISNSHYRSHSAPLFQKHDILNIYDSYKLELGVFMYKYFNGLQPMSFNAFFTKPPDIHNYDTRNKSTHNPTRNKKVFADKAIRTTGPILWEYR